jgi:hypothetical protein
MAGILSGVSSLASEHPIIRQRSSSCQHHLSSSGIECQWTEKRVHIISAQTGTLGKALFECVMNFI